MIKNPSPMKGSFFIYILANPSTTKMRITSVVFLLLTLICVAGIAQNFEGKLKYQNTYKSKIPNVTDDALAQMMGTALEYHFKDGNYRINTNGTFLQWQLYRLADSRVYTKFSNSASILWNDVTTNPDEVLKTELNKNVVDVLGYKCDELILTCKSGVQKYYFNSKLKIDPKVFEKHKFGNLSEYASKAGALPLKIVIDNVQFTMESVAASVEKQKIDDGLFALPDNATLEKNPYN
jgi:hypothetical protein